MALASSRTSAFRWSYRSATIPKVKAIMKAARPRMEPAMVETADSFSPSRRRRGDPSDPVAGLVRKDHNRGRSGEKDPDGDGIHAHFKSTPAFFISLTAAPMTSLTNAPTSDGLVVFGRPGPKQLVLP